MKFKQYLNEEMPVISPSLKKEFKAIGKEVNYQERYTDIFPKGKDTITLPVEGSYTAEIPAHLKEYVDNAIYTYKRLGELRKKIKYPNYINLKDNTDWENDKVIFSYGKEKVEVPIEEVIKVASKQGKGKLEFNLIKGMLNHNAWKHGPKFDKVAVVISRNPCDIATMSTNVGWRSCMNQFTGSYRGKTREDVRHGTLTVWFIDANDKKIEYPIGRTTIKPLKEFSGKGDKEYLQLTNKSYGDFPNKAKKVVEDWLKGINRGVKGIFTFKHELYNDDNLRGLIYKGVKKPPLPKIGDRVKAISPPDGNKKLVGQNGIVEAIDKTMHNPVKVIFEDGTHWWCEAESLEVIKKK